MAKKKDAVQKADTKKPKQIAKNKQPSIKKKIKGRYFLRNLIFSFFLLKLNTNLLAVETLNVCIGLCLL